MGQNQGAENRSCSSTFDIKLKPAKNRMMDCLLDAEKSFQLKTAAYLPVSPVPGISLRNLTCDCSQNCVLFVIEFKRGQENDKANL